MSNRLKIIVGVVVVLAVLAVIGSMGQTGDTGQASGTDSPFPIQTAGPTATPQATTLLSVTGNGIKQTQTFTASGEWAIAYNFDCSGFGGSGNFAVTVYGADGSLVDIPVNALAANGKDTTYEHATGTFYLEVDSECDWSLAAAGQP